ncbi:hypothetical protein [Jatrophihabitans sp.]|uniref:hypothetical protein n=1 Tax=Jatrophihabitans sp. TaxID=1932789 RepID=UPI0030C77885|nr:hypothetical protein [Jatrophihabitans sp.]
MTSNEEPVADVRAQLAGRLGVLAELDGRPLAEHADVYQQLHAELQATLAEIDSA